MVSGKSIGAYTIVGKLGEGGMGQVWRATDTTLGRQVAIKILPDAFASDPERLARFEREAKTLALLNHPHIAAIYGIEAFRSGGSSDPPLRALVMELVEGDDLSQRIARGPIPIDEALPIAKQIAEALEAAHEQGIIHRDLKPANIKVRADGTVKVLDFGLAKAMDQASGIGDQRSGRAANSPTITSPAMTMRGTILGTAAYMAPEQASGKAVDKRADVWSFGVVLLEMLTGQRLFDGERLDRQARWDAGGCPWESNRAPSAVSLGPHMADVWVRQLGSFDDDRRADREFWRAVTPDARIAAVEDLRKHWAKFQGTDDEGLRRTVRVLEAPER